ncbi:hypothetical protein FA95DRAFT_1684214 [Auriscalpium vulgare]|uniref:Uncharacterized protein n=1 Tax=Auriscalpium vulgare TaxID=40419 RepID=A0ACB8R7Q1_9AGAM|nr:hypothetical protein FA95DRAFT_1684214 [Auriscalpium vulgare]
MPPFLRGSTAIVQRASSTTFSVQRTPRPADSPVLDTAVTLAQMFGQVGTLVPIPAVSAAATALLGVLDAYTRVQANRDRCFRLAQRAFTILCELQEAMEGKWDDAPQTLLDNVVKFENVLLSLRDAMKQIASASVARRILSGSKFSGLLDDHEGRLQDMQSSFQVTSMVAVQYALHMQSARLLDIQRAVISTHSHGSSVSKDINGFHRYHQSAVKLQRMNNQALGWFSETTEGIVDGQKVLVKTYGQDNAATNLWAEEVKMLQNLFHANLPQLVGYSDEDTPNPFILLSNVQPYEYTSYMHYVAQTEDTDQGICKLLQAATDVFSAASFITQHLSLDKGQICLFIQNSTFVVDKNHFKVVVGLPYKGDQLHPVTMTSRPHSNEKWNQNLSVLIGERILHALETAAPNGYYYTIFTNHLLATIYATISGHQGSYPPRDWSGSIPHQFLMELPVQSQVGDVGYVTATSPVFHPTFNIYDQDPTARYTFRLTMDYSQNGLKQCDMSAPIFEWTDKQMDMIEDKKFKTTIQFLPPTIGTTRRLLSIQYDCHLGGSAFIDDNSVWTGSEPIGIELHLMRVSAVTFIDTYWLDCSVKDSQYSAPLNNGDFQEMKLQDLKFDLIAKFDPITSSRQVWLVGEIDTHWSAKYDTSLTLLETRGPRYSVSPLTTGQSRPNADGRYGVYFMPTC